MKTDCVRTIALFQGTKHRTGYLFERAAGILFLVCSMLAFTATGVFSQVIDPCVFNPISPSVMNFSSDGGPGSITVEPENECSWAATVDVGWIEITEGSSGVGYGVIEFQVWPNESFVSRTGILTLNNQSMTVTQEGAAAACTYSLYPTCGTFTREGGTGLVDVTTSDGCAWEATSDVSWIVIYSGSSGVGSGTVFYEVEANAGSDLRTGVLTIGDQTFVVTQGAAIPCTFNPISPSVMNFSSDGGPGSITLNLEDECSWVATVDVDWIEMITGSGVGQGVVEFQVLPNEGTASRTGILTLNNQSMTVIQEGTAAACTYSFSLTSQNFTASGGSGAVDVMTSEGCSWEVTSDVAWIRITSGSYGVGSGTVTYEVEANTGSDSRSGTLVLQGHYFFTVIQSGAGSASDPDDYEDGQGDDRVENATVIVIDGPPQHHNFYEPGDVDWVKFYGLAGQTYFIRAINMDPRANPVISVYDAGGTTLLASTELLIIGSRGISPHARASGEEVELQFSPDSDAVYAVQLKNGDPDVSGEDTGYDLEVITRGAVISASIRGRVTDASSGSPIEGVAIRTDWGLSALTVYTGEYIMPHPPGVFTLTAEAPGYETFTDTLSLAESEEVIKDFSMVPRSSDSCRRGGSNAGSNVTDTIDTAQCDTFYLLLDQTPLLTSKGRLYISLEVLSVPALSGLVWFRPSDDKAPPYLQPAKTPFGFTPNAIDLDYFRGMLGGEDLEFKITGTGGIKGQRVVFATHCLPAGLDLNEDNLESIQRVEILFQ